MAARKRNVVGKNTGTVHGKRVREYRGEEGYGW